MTSDASLPEALRTFAEGLASRYDYPVDTQLVAPDGRVLGHLPVELLFSSEEMDYAGALRKALGEVGSD